MAVELKSLLHTYLRTHKRLVVPQLGAFIAREAGGEAVFSELLRRDDGVLRGLLTAEGLSEIEAAGAIDRFIFDLRHAVQHGDTYAIDGVGRFTAGENQALHFVYDPGTQDRSGAEPSAAPAADAPQTAAPDSAAAAAHPAAEASAPRSVASNWTEYPSKRPPRKPDPSVKGLTYGKPIKTTDAYTFVGSAPRRRVDKFLIVAILAAVLAIGAIAYGYIQDRRAKEVKEIFESDPAALVDEGAAAEQPTQNAE